jgi:hypothetical protein
MSLCERSPAWQAVVTGLRLCLPSLHRVGDEGRPRRQAEEGRLPMPHDAAEAAALVERARRLQSAQGGQVPLNQELLKKLAYTAAGELSPMAAIIGGCVGQEARPFPAPSAAYAAAQCRPVVLARMRAVYHVVTAYLLQTRV